MRLPTTFQRQKGGTSPPPALGSDAVPTTSPPANGTDNFLSCRTRDINGWPVQRIVACWTTTAGSPTALNGSLYLWEKATAHWYLVNATPVSMEPNQLYFFDVAAIAEPPANKANVLGSASNPGSGAGDAVIDALLVVSDPGAQVNGTFTIAMGPDISNVGT
jgi:hypothetical protein